AVLTETPVGRLLALKLFLVIVALMLSAHRDFALVSRLAQEMDAGRNGAPELRAMFDQAGVKPEREVITY
ncbi:MAG: hypothetical protein HYZ72_00950, partial [Deltaproteobacteria bacterium]|nr:hypothetical protein [Deltaproteobacteria bacterium]